MSNLPLHVLQQQIVELEKQRDELQRETARLRAALIECEHQTHSMRVWGGQSWSYHPPQAGKIAKEARTALDVPNMKQSPIDLMKCEK